MISGLLRIPSRRAFQFDRLHVLQMLLKHERDERFDKRKGQRFKHCFSP
jgi:hypothetical protein